MPLLTELAHRSKLIEDLDALPGLWERHGRCLKHGMEFSITADLDCAVRETIGEIPDGKWRSVVRGKETFLPAETLHAPGGATVAPLCRR